MKVPILTVDSLDLVELAIVFEEIGLLGSHIERLRPFIVAPSHAKMYSHGIEADATVIARNLSAVIFLEDGHNWLGVGRLDEDNRIPEFRRYRSPEMAIRAFERAIDNCKSI